jgi:ferric-dicitrate binding protein FerR (iron transport regulator)
MNYLPYRSSRLEAEQAVERAKRAGRREIWFVALLSGALIAPLIAVVSLLYWGAGQ